MRLITATDGVRLAVEETGSGPTILAVHGYPDNRSVWDGVVSQLQDRFRVVTYDVRGAGGSDAPASRRAYRINQLVDDLAAVLDATAGDGPVHLLAHDWGSVQSWPALTDERCAGRIASFTSISGPSLDHAAMWFRHGRRHPRATARQLAMSWYALGFQLPLVPDLAARRGWIDAATRRGPGSHRSPDDALHGLKLYRANLRLRRPAPGTVDVPVLVLAPDRDRYISVALQTEAPLPYVRDLRTEVIDGGHWFFVKRPEALAARVARFVEERAL